MTSLANDLTDYGAIREALANRVDHAANLMVCDRAGAWPAGQAGVHLNCMPSVILEVLIYILLFACCEQIWQIVCASHN
jgi:hypothetical protein